MPEPSHLNDLGEANMVDVGDKTHTRRSAIAQAVVQLSPEAFRVVADQNAAKGDVLAAARIAGIMAAKRTADLIPLCHQIALTHAEVDFTPISNQHQVIIKAKTESHGPTGVEMEALTVATVAALTIYDMLKSVDRQISFGQVQLLEKKGGRSGNVMRGVRAVRKTPPWNQGQQASEPESVLAAEPSSADEERRRPLLPPRKEGPFDEERRKVENRPEPSEGSMARAAFVRTVNYEDPALQNLLRQDPITSAYMLGDLDVPYAEHCTWFGLDEEQLNGVLLLYTGLRTPAVLTKGGAEEVEALIHATHDQLPQNFYCQLRPEHRRALECHFQLGGLKKMIRMALVRDEYTSQGAFEEVEALTHRHTGAIMRLYHHYPDNFFEPALLDTGHYFGMHRDGELISVAGIHVLSEKYDVAAIGNIVTHADYRGQGLATHCVGRLLEALFPKVNHVTLNVRESNESAIACYQKFGFTERYNFLEGWATNRS